MDVFLRVSEVDRSSINRVGGETRADSVVIYLNERQFKRRRVPVAPLLTD